MTHEGDLPAPRKRSRLLLIGFAIALSALVECVIAAASYGMAPVCADGFPDSNVAYEPEIAVMLGFVVVGTLILTLVVKRSDQLQGRVTLVVSIFGASLAIILLIVVLALPGEIENLRNAVFTPKSYTPDCGTAPAG